MAPAIASPKRDTQQAMSEEPTTPDPVELTRRQFEFAKVRDLDGVVSFYGPDTDWDMTPGGLMKYDGAAALRRFLEVWTTSYKEWDVTLEEAHDLGGGIVLAVVLQRGRSSRRVDWIELRFATVASWVDGRIARITSYIDIDEARAAGERLAHEGK
jgi:ketosteroid isomerase-like protein